MRSDAQGLFWHDEARVKPPKKEKIKRTPPERFWEVPGYTPSKLLVEARSYMPNLFTEQEILAAQGERVVYDIEVYPNYACFAFKSIKSGKIIFFEMGDGFPPLNTAMLRMVLNHFCIVNFNGLRYDFPVTTLALAGYGTEALWDATEMIIGQEQQASEVYKKYKTQKLHLNQIDLIQLTANAPGLKVCAGRLHAPRLQDLPFAPGTYLTPDQITILRYYNINDLDNTIILYNSLTEQIELRESVGTRYGLDLRSHSDAQMAEAIVASEVKKLKGVKYLTKSKVDPSFTHKYQPPSYIRFQTPLMNSVLEAITSKTFRVDGYTGEVVPPVEFEDMVIHMAAGKYKVGIGGMHTQEENIAHVADDDYEVIDTDVTSYYPFLILNAGLAPANLGTDFLRVFRSIVDERVRAKERGDTVTAECLKIVINGTFGKLGSKWSVMYSPDLMLQVTITGQLSILMLAEACELNGIQVCSVNTDGIVVRCHKSKREFFNSLVKWWQQATGLKTEETRYKGTYSKDVNNYIAVYETPQKGEVFKTKGLYAKTSSKKNAVNEICIKAVKAYIECGTNPSDTIRACRDIKLFTSMRFVAGGAVKADEFLGKLIRWYYSTGAQGEIISAKSGNKVARTDNATPLMNIPAEFPDDVNYDWYVEETYKILAKIGYTNDTPVEDEA